MGLTRWMKLLINWLSRLGFQENMVGNYYYYFAPSRCIYVVYKGLQKQGSLLTGAQLATRGRRDMSSRVRDVVLSLALCHNVSLSTLNNVFHC